MVIGIPGQIALSPAVEVLANVSESPSISLMTVHVPKLSRSKNATTIYAHQNATVTFWIGQLVQFYVGEASVYAQLQISQQHMRTQTVP
jgi:hypothetical protein